MVGSGFRGKGGLNRSLYQGPVMEQLNQKQNDSTAEHRFAKSARIIIIKTAIGQRYLQMVSSAFRQSAAETATAFKLSTLRIEAHVPDEIREFVCDGKIPGRASPTNR
jgi:hypothetical protein